MPREDVTQVESAADGSADTLAPVQETVVEIPTTRQRPVDTVPERDSATLSGPVSGQRESVSGRLETVTPTTAGCEDSASATDEAGVMEEFGIDVPGLIDMADPGDVTSGTGDEDEAEWSRWFSGMFQKAARRAGSSRQLESEEGECKEDE